MVISLDDVSNFSCSPEKHWWWLDIGDFIITSLRTEKQSELPRQADALPSKLNGSTFAKLKHCCKRGWFEFSLLRLHEKNLQMRTAHIDAKNMKLKLLQPIEFLSQFFQIKYRLRLQFGTPTLILHPINISLHIYFNLHMQHSVMSFLEKTTLYTNYIAPGRKKIKQNFVPICDPQWYPAARGKYD